MLPDRIHSDTGVTPASSEPDRKPRKIGQDSAHDANSAAVVTSLAAVLPIARLPSPATTAASSGRKTMKRISFSPSSG
jgi:hypothetical protein